MLLLVRFLLMMIVGRLRRGIGPFDSSVVRCTALPHDCDLNFHLNGGRYVSFMDIARIELLVRMRVFGRLLARGWRPVMGGCTVRFRRPILPFERFEIRSRLVGWDEKWFYFEQFVERRGSLCATGIARLLFRNREGSTAPREILAALEMGDLASPPLPEFVDAWRHAEAVR